MKQVRLLSCSINVVNPVSDSQKLIVTIDQYTGRILNKREPMQSTHGDWFVRMLHPLHSGEIGGTGERCLVFISGLLPLILYITGVIRWRQKNKVRI